MNRPAIWIVCLLPLLGCRIEPTPREYFDHTAPIEAERVDAGEEVRSRILAFGEALGRRDGAAARAALAPASQVYVVGPTAGEVHLGAGEVGALLERLGRLGPLAVDVQEVQVWVGPRANVAWFAARFAVPGLPRAEEWRMTGVYLREEGAWQLVQAHLSTPATTLPELPPYPQPAAAPEAGAATAAPGASEAGGS